MGDSPPGIEATSSKSIVVTRSARNANTKTKSICAKSNVGHFVGPKWADSLGLVASRSDHQL
ncbi:hypothetical protein KIN20_020235 [Parelaphostrongylus tenuis]|uniref:Uncharacterized protein n=1 Tax=Parelaphostrongylus tenuis TaxID=148309 RepID=A0AAD5N9K5_PARTN|nr:hypothetical protein KIN20_020235 [Parelaphostrongylus tenuis]